jgi:hypothetical protein
MLYPCFFKYDNSHMRGQQETKSAFPVQTLWKWFLIAIPPAGPECCLQPE